MKNKSSLMFILKLIIVLLILILLLLVLFLYKKIFGNKVETTKITNKVIIKKYNLKNISSIEFDFKNYEVKYLSSNEEKLKIKQVSKTKKYYVDKEKLNQKLVLRESVSNIFDKKKYTIYIPKSFDGDINIINGFGNISINNLKKIKLDNNSGNVKIKNIDELDIKNVSGNIYILGKTNDIISSSSTGNIIIDKINGSCKIESITGDIRINNFYILSNSNISTTSGDIMIKINKKSDCILKYDIKEEYSITNKKCIDGENILKIKNVTGIIDIK